MYSLTQNQGLPKKGPFLVGRTANQSLCGAPPVSSAGLTCSQLARAKFRRMPGPAPEAKLAASERRSSGAFFGMNQGILRKEATTSLRYGNCPGPEPPTSTQIQEWRIDPIGCRCWENNKPAQVTRGNGAKVLRCKSTECINGCPNCLTVKIVPWLPLRTRKGTGPQN